MLKKYLESNMNYHEEYKNFKIQLEQICKTLSSANLETYLNTITFPKLQKEKRKTLDSRITEKSSLHYKVWKIINHQEIIG